MAVFIHLGRPTMVLATSPTSTALSFAKVTSQCTHLRVGRSVVTLDGWQPMSACRYPHTARHAALFSVFTSRTMTEARGKRDEELQRGTTSSNDRCIHSPFLISRIWFWTQKLGKALRATLDISGVSCDDAGMSRLGQLRKDGVRLHGNGYIIERYHGACRIFNGLFRIHALSLLCDS